MTMEMAHEVGCDQRHTRRQWCNGPVAESSRRATAQVADRMTDTRRASELAETRESLLVSTDQIVNTAALELIPFLALPLFVVAGIAILLGIPALLPGVLLWVAVASSGFGWIKAGYRTGGLVILGIRVVFLSIPVLWSVVDEVQINIDSGPSGDEGAIMLWFVLASGWPLVSCAWLFSELHGRQRSGVAS